MSKNREKIPKVAGVNSLLLESNGIGEWKFAKKLNDHWWPHNWNLGQTFEILHTILPLKNRDISTWILQLFLLEMQNQN